MSTHGGGGQRLPFYIKEKTMSNIIPEEITDREAAKTWLLRHGYSEDLAEEELSHWGHADPMMHTHDDGVEHSHEGGDEPHDHEEEWEDEEEEEWEDEDEEDEDNSLPSDSEY